MQHEVSSCYSYIIGAPCILYNISMIHYHNRRTAFVNCYSNYGGLVSLKLSIVKCLYESSGCITQYHKIYLQWKLHQYSFTQKFIIQSEGWTFELNYHTSNWCGDCQYLRFSENQYCTQLPPHQDLLIRFFQDYSYPLIVDYTNGKQNFEQLDNHQIIFERNLWFGLYFEMLIKNHHDSLFILKIQTESIYIQSRIRDFEIFYTEPEEMHRIFNEGCLQQIDKKCLTCLEGWIQDQFLENCHPFCGDGIIQGQEECDNLVSDVGCSQCKFSCPNFCNQCKFGKCLECQSNYQLINSSCEEINKNNGFEPLNQNYNSFSNLEGIYGNYGWGKLMIMRQEFCCIIISFISFILYHLQLQGYFVNQNPSHDFQIFEILQYYFQNFKRIIIQNCLKCLFEVCLECQPFYKLSYNKKYCIPICNDGIIIENEICDDLNNIQFDGCHQCQLDCQLECNQCIKQQCYSCIDGWQIINYRCYQICGDGYLAISSSEQCDDGNYQPYDGCYNCNFECKQNCLYCDSSKNCLECQDNFEKSDQNYCKPICGDGIIIEGLEECEDLNDIQYDGCYQCFFQCSQNCSKCKQGKCQVCAEGYDLIINECRQVTIINANQTDDNNAVQSQQCGDQILSINEQCDDGNQYSGDGCSINCKTEENWKCNEEQPNQCFKQTKFFLKYENQTYEHQFVFLMFSNEVKQVSEISFQDSILAEITNLNKNQSTLIDNNEMPVLISSEQLLLKEPKVLTQIQIKVANRFKDIGNALIISLGAISILMLLFGDPSQSLEIFDVLQYQSYLKFVQAIFQIIILISYF